MFLAVSDFVCFPALLAITFGDISPKPNCNCDNLGLRGATHRTISWLGPWTYRETLLVAKQTTPKENRRLRNSSGLYAKLSSSAAGFTHTFLTCMNHAMSAVVRVVIMQRPLIVPELLCFVLNETTFNILSP